MTSIKLLGFAAVLAAATLGITSACSDSSGPTEGRTFYGPSLNIGQGTARAWVDVDAQGAPTALGISMTEQALSGLPSAVMPPSPSAVMLTLPLPEQARATGFDHAELAWNPQGHEPQQLYGVPHFDLHFYLVSRETQLAILPSDPQFATKAASFPAAAYVPAGYVPPPGPAVANAVPQMGVHWTDTRSPELTGQPFTSTLIYGSWDGQFIFIEPMITKAYLETHPNSTVAIPQASRWAKPGDFPTTYTVGYDAGPAKEYRIALGGLTRRQ